jgi:hypothetical protein
MRPWQRLHEKLHTQAFTYPSQMTGFKIRSAQNCWSEFELDIGNRPLGVAFLVPDHQFIFISRTRLAAKKRFSGQGLDSFDEVFRFPSGHFDAGRVVASSAANLDRSNVAAEQIPGAIDPKPR